MLPLDAGSALIASRSQNDKEMEERFPFIGTRCCSHSATRLSVANCNLGSLLPAKTQKASSIYQPRTICKYKLGEWCTQFEK